MYHNQSVYTFYVCVFFNDNCTITFIDCVEIKNKMIDQNEISLTIARVVEVYLIDPQSVSESVI